MQRFGEGLSYQVAGASQGGLLLQTAIEKAGSPAILQRLHLLGTDQVGLHGSEYGRRHGYLPDPERRDQDRLASGGRPGPADLPDAVTAFI
jgi:hypothetical protein